MPNGGASPAGRARVTVQDRSMEPTLRPGDRLYVELLRGEERRVRTGEIIVLRDPEDPARWLIKRVGATSEDAPTPERPPLPVGTLLVVGDNRSASRDSRQFGPVSVDSVVGIVRSRYWPMDRRGPLPKA